MERGGGGRAGTRKDSEKERRRRLGGREEEAYREAEFGMYDAEVESLVNSIDVSVERGRTKSRWGKDGGKERSSASFVEEGGASPASLRASERRTKSWMSKIVVLVADGRIGEKGREGVEMKMTGEGEGEGEPFQLRLELSLLPFLLPPNRQQRTFKRYPTSLPIPQDYPLPISISLLASTGLLTRLQLFPSSSRIAIHLFSCSNPTFPQESAPSSPSTLVFPPYPFSLLSWNEQRPR